MVNERRLSNELWGHIVSLLQSELHRIPGHRFYGHRFYGLPIVCKQFNAVFRQHPELYHTLVLEQLSCTFFTALATLQYQTPHLQTIAISEFDNMVPMHLLSAFTSLAKCVCHGGPEHGLFLLQPLQSLPNLRSFTLVNCHNYHLKCLHHLTSLDIQQSSVECSSDCAFVSVLLDLRLVTCGIAHVCDQGLFVCTRLESLVCSHSMVEAVNQNEGLSAGVDGLNLPSGLSALTALSMLVLGCCSDDHTQRVQLCYISHVPASRSLCLHVDRT